MARYEITPYSEWSAGLLADGQDLTVQCVEGTVAVSVEAAPAVRDGLELHDTPGMLQSAIVRDGSTVRWKNVGGRVAVIAVEAMG